jgi:RNA polymerase sigma factor (sigma-70 family)
VEDTAYFQSRQRIFEMLSGLTEQEKTLITLRYGLESGKPLTTQQVAEQLNISPEEALSLEAGALAKMRKEG